MSSAIFIVSARVALGVLCWIALVGWLAAAKGVPT